MIDKKLLKKFWIQFNLEGKQYALQSMFISKGVGVTAFTKEDALELIQSKIFKNEKLPPVTEISEDHDTSTIKDKKITSNMGACTWRGIWYPNCF